MDQQGQSVLKNLRLTEVLDTRRNEVWHAVDSSSGDSAAVKLLNPAYEAILPRRFGKRNRALANALRQTSGWVPLLDHGTAGDGRQYVSMPYYPAGSLADQLRHGKTSWQLSTTLITQSAVTIGGAHENGWSFGHLRPSNILLSQTNEPDIFVYGSSTRRFNDGTAQFMAPEVARDEVPVPASDVYTLSLILASLIAGRQIDNAEPVATVLDEIAGHAPKGVVEIIDYGLSPGIRNRFADAAKMASALSASLSRPDPAIHSSGSSETNISGSDNPLDALLAGPLVEPAVPDLPTLDRPTDLGHSGSTHPNPQGNDVGLGAAANHPELPAALRDLTISSSPRPSRPPPVDPPTVHSQPDFDLEDPTDPGLGSDQNQSNLDAETDPGFSAELDDPTLGLFGPENGPLSDLLDSQGPKTPMVTYQDPDPTMDRRQGQQARKEISSLIDQLGWYGAEHQPAGQAYPNDDRSSGDQEDRPGDGTVDDRGRHDTGHTAIDLTTSEADLSTEPTEPAEPNVEPFRVPANGDLIGFVEGPTTESWYERLLAAVLLHRRRIVSSASMLGLTAIAGVIVVVGAQAIRSSGVTAPEGSATDDISATEDEVDRSSPINNLDHLDDAKSIGLPTTAATTRKRFRKVGQTGPTTTLDPATNQADQDDLADRDGQTTTTSEPSSVSPTSKMSTEPGEPTTTADEPTTANSPPTTKRRGKRKRP